MFVAVYHGESFHNYPTITRWFNMFIFGCQSLEGDPCSGRPSRFLMQCISCCSASSLWLWICSSEACCRDVANTTIIKYKYPELKYKCNY